jgi:HlyD family type I secretion membrane fusion protein
MSTAADSALMSRLPGVAEQADRAALEPHLAEVRALRRRGLLLLLVLALPAFAWLALAPLTDAVVAAGVVKVDLDKRAVQHAEGGTVREVLVRDGQRVAQGQPLLVLGDVAVDADQNRVNYRVLAEMAGVARLEAELAGDKAIRFPAEVESAAAADPRLGEQIGKERSLFATRRDALTGQVTLLRAQQARMAEEIEGLKAQIAQASESLRLQTADLDTQRNLAKDGFLSPARITQLEATVSDYRVKLEERRSELARAQQRVVDADLRIKALQSEYRQQASDQLKVAASRLNEMLQEQRKSSDAARRQVVVAPVAGDVLNLRFASPGGVVAPREPIADIVPAQPKLVVEVRLRTEDVARVQVGQTADIRFTAFKYRTTQLVAGRVTYLAPDRLVDRATEAAYYTSLIEADPASLAAAGQIELRAGMPAEVYITGRERTPLQYLLEPVTDVARRAGRER